MTMAKAVVALTLLLTCVSAAVELQRRKSMCPPCPKPDHAPPPGDFNFYFLVREWPYTFCSYNPCYKAPDQNNGFTLHGLWPNLDNHCYADYPQVCAHSKYDSDNIPTGVLNDMADMWTSYKSDDDCFRNHEWQCHGTCSNYTQARYFTEVVRLHKANNIAAALEEHNIVPSSQPVSTAAFAQALKKEFGYAPILHCRDHTYIDEVWQCVDRDTLQVMDCNQACQVPTSCAVQKNQECGSSIIYDTPQIPLSPPPTDCTLHCKEKSGTCHN